MVFAQQHALSKASPLHLATLQARERVRPTSQCPYSSDQIRLQTAGVSMRASIAASIYTCREVVSLCLHRPPCAKPHPGIKPERDVSSASKAATFSPLPESCGVVDAVGGASCGPLPALGAVGDTEGGELEQPSWLDQSALLRPVEECPPQPVATAAAAGITPPTLGPLKDLPAEVMAWLQELTITAPAASTAAIVLIAVTKFVFKPLVCPCVLQLQHLYPCLDIHLSC